MIDRWRLHAEQSTKWRAVACNRAVGSLGVLVRIGYWPVFSFVGQPCILPGSILTGGLYEADCSSLCRSFLGGASLPAPIFTTEASANRMNGKASCGMMNCMQDRYNAAKRKEAKTKKPK
jgi:hypothetical protein